MTGEMVEVHEGYEKQSVRDPISIKDFTPFHSRKDPVAGIGQVIGGLSLLGQVQVMAGFEDLAEKVKRGEKLSSEEKIKLIEQRRYIQKGASILHMTIGEETSDINSLLPREDNSWSEGDIAVLNYFGADIDYERDLSWVPWENRTSYYEDKTNEFFKTPVGQQVMNRFLDIDTEINKEDNLIKNAEAVIKKHGNINPLTEKEWTNEELSFEVAKSIYDNTKKNAPIYGLEFVGEEYMKKNKED